MLASDLTPQQSYALLTKAECLFAAIWHNPRGAVDTEAIAQYYEVSADAVLSILSSHHSEFEGELLVDNWTPRAAIRLGMLLNSPQATRVRSLALDVVEAHKCKAKKEQVAFLLQKAEFVEWSNREIAKILSCSPTIVGETRKELEAKGNVVRFERRKHIRNGKVVEREAAPSFMSSGGHEQPSNPDSTVTVTAIAHPRYGQEGVVVAQKEGHWQKLVRFEDGEEPIADRDLSDYRPVERRLPPEYQEAIAQLKEQHQREVERLESDLKAGAIAQAEEVARKSLQAQIAAAQELANQKARENAKLRQTIAELESLRTLEAENVLLRQRVEELERAVQDIPAQRWNNTFTKQAERVVNAEVQKMVENLEPELHLRQTAVAAPAENPRGTITLLGLSLTAMANGHPRFARELRKAAAIVLGVEEPKLDAKSQQLAQLPLVIASIREVLRRPDVDWAQFTGVGDRYDLIKQEIWLELTAQEREKVGQLSADFYQAGRVGYSKSLGKKVKIQKVNAETKSAEVQVAEEAGFKVLPFADIKPIEEQEFPELTQIQVGSRVAGSDQYHELYLKRGTVIGFDQGLALVHWDDCQQPLFQHRYELGELRIIRNS